MPKTQPFNPLKLRELLAFAFATTSSCTPEQWRSDPTTRTTFRIDADKVLALLEAAGIRLQATKMGRPADEAYEALVTVPAHVAYLLEP